MASFITGIAYYQPEQIMHNEAIALQHPEWSIDKIASKTGIHQRNIAAKDEFCSDMAVTAANIFFQTYAFDKQKIDYLLLCTQTPDYLLPTTACIVQHRLGLNKSVGALDINLGCSGFVYGLSMAKGLVETGQAKHVLLITSDTYSKLIHEKDKNNKTIFGDAATATLISHQATQEALAGSIQQFEFATDGSKFDALIVQNGALRHRFERGTDVYNADNEFVKNDDFLFMDGKEIFSFTAFEVPKLIDATLIKHGLTLSDIDLFVFHQANNFMLQTIRKRIGIPEEKFFVHLHDCGNTVSSSIPLAMSHAVKAQKIQKGMKVLLAGFGVGLSMSATVVNY